MLVEAEGRVCLEVGFMQGYVYRDPREGRQDE